MDLYVVGQMLFASLSPFVAPLVGAILALTTTLYLYTMLKRIMDI